MNKCSYLATIRFILHVCVVGWLQMKESSIILLAIFRNFVRFIWTKGQIEGQMLYIWDVVPLQSIYACKHGLETHTILIRPYKMKSKHH